MACNDCNQSVETSVPTPSPSDCTGGCLETQGVECVFLRNDLLFSVIGESLETVLTRYEELLQRYINEQNAVLAPADQIVITRLTVGTFPATVIANRVGVEVLNDTYNNIDDLVTALQAIEATWTKESDTVISVKGLGAWELTFS